MLVKIIFLIFVPACSFAGMSPAKLADLISIKLNQALALKDPSSLERVPGISKKTKTQFKDFLKQHPFSSTDCADFWTGSAGATLVIKYKKQSISLNLMDIEKNQIQINGVTIFLSGDFEKVYSQISQAFPKESSVLFNLFVPQAQAGVSDRLKALTTTAAVFTLEIYKNIPAKDVMDVLLYPMDEGEWILESFSCNRPQNSISYKILGLSKEAQKNARLVDMLFQETLENMDIVVTIRGNSCAVEYLKKPSKDWNLGGIVDDRCKNFTKIELQKYHQMKICCENDPCEKDLVARMNELKKKYSKDYGKIDPRLKAPVTSGAAK